MWGVSHHYTLFGSFPFLLSSTANRYLLRAMSRVGAGASEFFDGSAKSKWERKVWNSCQQKRLLWLEMKIYGMKLFIDDNFRQSS